MSEVRSAPPTPSPAATGAAGPFFEQHVGAAFLSLLLLRAKPPCLPDCQLAEVHLQTKHKGWHTDDLLIVGKRSDGQSVQMAAQVKRTFVVGHKDEDFRKTIADAWHDFQGRTVFNSATDILAVIVLRGSELLLNHFVTLLEQARFSRDGPDFQHRLTALLNQTTQRYYNAVQTAVDEAAGSPQAPADLFNFLRHLYLLSFDLNSATAQTEAWLKTLLAHTANGPDKVAAAAATWNELLALVGAGEPQAASFAYQDLPASARQRHEPVARREYQALTTLQQHAVPIERSARKTIHGTFHLPRTKLVGDIIAAIDRSRVIVITGAPGSGKSALAGAVFADLSQEMPAFAFRAEEFARPHLDETLHAAQVQLTAQQLMALLALHPRKVIWVESLERLLEKADRAAFADLLQLVHEDDTCRLILTCRDYSTDLVRGSFLEQAGISHGVVTVPLLSDAELEQALERFPQIKGVALIPRIRELLRNPYILDIAARMEWKPGPLPGNVRSFRSKVWRELIREEARTQDAMPQRRGTTLLEVALRRARALQAYAECSDLDHLALQRLRESGLIEFSDRSDSYVATTHDVLEDWALLRWLDERFVAGQQDPDAFVEAVGAHPALRRAYRSWLEEMLDCAPDDADALVASVLVSRRAPRQSRDDTLVAVLLSIRCQAFLERNEPQLLADNCALLRRVIHLLRVGCRTSMGSPQLETEPLIQYLPKYPAWATALGIVRKHLAVLKRDNGELVLGLLEDWAEGINWLLPYPPGAKDSAHIAFAMLPMSDDWRLWQRDARKRLLKVIAKIPKAAPEQIKDLSQRAAEQRRDDRTADEFAKLVLQHPEGTLMCRDFPEEVIRMAEAIWGISAASRRKDGKTGFRDNFQVETAFGLAETLHFDFYPPSAYHGPFWALLGNHPKLGKDFIIRLMNYCADSYGDPNTFHRFVELPGKATLVMPDGALKEQWCNWRLWALFRGVSVGPQVLQCALMALERWLLNVCQRNPEQVEGCLLQLLCESNNAAISAVVAGVSIAHPQLSGTAGLLLLTSPQFIELDRARMCYDHHPLGRIFDRTLAINAEHAFYASERREADGFEHRRGDLETLAVQLQTGRQMDRVREILDNFYNGLPPEEEQSESDKLWRLALLRMDLRRWEVKGKNRDQRVMLGPKLPEPDVQAVIDAHAPRQEAFARRMRLFTWGAAVFRRDETPQVDPSKWREWCHEAQEIHAILTGSRDTETDLDWRMAAAGPAYVAAVLARDHWTELTTELRDWAVGVIIDSVSRDADSKDHLFIAARYPMDASRPTAFILPALFNCGFSPARHSQLLKTLALALTHASDEVRDYAAEGVGSFLWKADRSLAMTCVGALVAGARAEEAALKQEELKPWQERAPTEVIRNPSKRAVREAIRGRHPLNEGALVDLDLDGWPGQRAIHYLLAILGPCFDEAIARSFFSKIAETLVAWWRKDHERRRDHSGNRNSQLEHLCEQRLAEFALRLDTDAAVKLCLPLISAAEEFPKEIGDFVKELIIKEDSMGSGEVFWTLWQRFADRTGQARWVSSLSERYPEETTLINALFLGVSWKEGVRHWQRLTGHATRLDRFFETLPLTAPTLEAYSRYLLKLGEKSLPEALVLLANKLRQAGTDGSLFTPNSQFYLESILRRWVLSQPAKLKERPETRSSVLDVLDELVEAGSSVAYRLRDDFVTPAQPVARAQ